MTALTTVHTDSQSEEALVVAIYRYRSQWNDFLAKSYVNDQTPAFYAPALKKLENWHRPAEDANAANEALSLALEIHEIGESEVIPAMVRAAKGFLDNDAKQRLREDASPELLAIIDEVQATHQAWVTCVPDDEDLPDDCAEEDLFCAAEASFISFPCKNIWDVHQKSAWLLSGRGNQNRTANTVLNGIETVHMIAFLRSLLGLPAEKEI